MIIFFRSTRDTKAAIAALEYMGGTTYLHLGLNVGMQLLAEDKLVRPSKKYVIVITDGYTMEEQMVNLANIIFYFLFLFYDQIFFGFRSLAFSLT